VPSALVVSPLLPYPPHSGGQKRTLRLLDAMERAGLRPHVVTAHEAADADVAALRERGWDVDVRPFRPGMLDRLTQHAARRPSPYLSPVAEVVAEAPAAMVQLEHTMSVYYRDLRPGTPVVLSLHNLDSEIGGRGWRARYRASALRVQERRAIPDVDHVLCVSEHDAAAVADRGGRPLLVPNGVDADLFHVDRPAGTPTSAFFGHFGYAPNRDGLLRFLREGWGHTRAAIPAATLVVAGAGIGGGLQRELDGFGGVEVVGVVPDVGALLARSTVVVVPLWQGGGTRLKVLEAMAAARAVVGTPLGVARIGFRPGEHGLVEREPAALGAALAVLLRDPVRAAALGARARTHAERYRWERTTAELEELYATQAQRAPGR
jgi:polysaccharide biosynthesis protein PslH